MGVPVDSVYVALAIGLVLAFFLLSLVVSGLNEAVNRLLGVRSKFLWAYLRDLLDGPVGGKSRMPARLMDVLWRVPRNSLPGGDPRPVFNPLPPPADIGVSAAPPAAPADAGTPALDTTPAPAGRPDLATVVRPALADRMYERLRAVDQSTTRRTSLSNIPPNRFAVGLLEIVAGEYDGDVGALLAELKASGSALYGPLAGLWQSAAGDLDRLREGIAEWFDGEMSGLSALYRRQVRWVLTLLALVVTLVISVDVLEFGKSVLRDDALRREVVAVANGNPDALDRLQDTCVATGSGESAADQRSDPYGCVTDVLSTPALVRILTNAPIGLSLPAEGNPTWIWNGGDWWDRLTGPGHWLGFALTVIALLFGAPFWWDVLRRLTGLKPGGSEGGERSG